MSNHSTLIQRIQWSQKIPPDSYCGSTSADLLQSGLEVDHVWFAWLGDQVIADFQLEFHTPFKTFSIHSHVSQEYQNQGIATYFYDAMQALLSLQGITLVPGEFQTQAAQSFWSKRRLMEKLHLKNSTCVNSDSLLSTRILKI